MKFAIFGAGAVGGFLGARLLEGGHEVHFIARGRNRDVLATRGLRVRSQLFGHRTYDVCVSSDPMDVGPVDYVVLGVKASALGVIAPLVEPLKGRDTTFVSTQNGLPWWYSHGALGEERPIESVDPGGVVLRYMPASQVVGSIVYFSCSRPNIGVVEHAAGTRLPLGEAGGGRSERILKLSEALRTVGVKAPVRNDIRHELWVKLLGNGAFNPLTALTGTTLAELLESDHGYGLAVDIMDEIRQVASAVGVQIAISNERRIGGARAAGHHKPSMLQDLERGAEPEIDALLGSIIELAERNNVSVPTLSAIDRATRILFAKASKASAGIDATLATPSRQGPF